MAQYFLGSDGILLVERRSTPRLDVDLDVEISLAAGREPIRGSTKNLSESGVQVVLPRSIPEARVVVFECPFFEGTAQVVWNSIEEAQVRIGLRFVSLAPKDRDALLEVITRAKRELAQGLMAVRA